MGPKNGKIMAKNQMGITTGNLAAALLHKLLHSCIPIAFSHTKYSGVQANPNVINCKHTKQILLCYLFIYVCMNIRISKMYVHAWWMSIKMTAMSLEGDLGRREKALE
jgi:hypothetical protein